jgi:hypothetical protein
MDHLPTMKRVLDDKWDDLLGSLAPCFVHIKNLFIQKAIQDPVD